MHNSDENNEPVTPPAASAATNAPVVLPPAGQTQPEQPAENGGDNSGDNNGTGISAAYIDEMNKQLPQMIADGVRWDKTVYAESSNALIMQITMTKLRLGDLNSSQLNELQSAIGPAMAKTACADPNVSPWLTQHNGTLIIAFYDKSGKHLVDGSVSGSDCQ